MTASAENNLSRDAEQRLNQRISTTGKYIYMVWQEKVETNPDIFFTASMDGGANFGEPINLSNNNGKSALPEIASSGSNVYVVWNDDTSGNSEIFASISNDHGVTFSEPNNLSNNINISANPKVVIPERDTNTNNAFVAWTEMVALGNFDIMFSRSTDGGKSFSFPLNISNNEGSSSNHRLYSIGNEVYIIWQDDSSGNKEITLLLSQDNGKNFGSPTNISHSDEDSVSPYFVAVPGRLHITWNELRGENSDIFYTNGHTSSGFLEPINLSGGVGSSLEYSMGVTTNSVYVAWQSDLSGASKMFIATSLDGGHNFETPLSLLGNYLEPVDPKIFASDSSNAVLVTWSSLIPNSNNRDIFVARSTDNAITFGDVVNISNDEGTSVHPLIFPAEGATDRDEILLAWFDNEKTAGGLNLMSSNDGGSTFAPINFKQYSPKEFRLIASSNSYEISLGKDAAVTLSIQVPTNFNKEIMIQPYSIDQPEQFKFEVSPLVSRYDNRLQGYPEAKVTVFTSEQIKEGTFSVLLDITYSDPAGKTVTLENVGSFTVNIIPPATVPPSDTTINDTAGSESQRLLQPVLENYLPVALIASGIAGGIGATVSHYSCKRNRPVLGKLEINATLEASSTSRDSHLYVELDGTDLSGKIQLEEGEEKVIKRSVSYNMMQFTHRIGVVYDNPPKKIRWNGSFSSPIRSMTVTNIEVRARRSYNNPDFTIPYCSIQAKFYRQDNSLQELDIQNAPTEKIHDIFIDRDWKMEMLVSDKSSMQAAKMPISAKKNIPPSTGATPPSNSRVAPVKGRLGKVLDKEDK